MAKKILLILLTILIAAAGLAGYAIYNANSLIARHKASLERLASSALKTPVAIESFETAIIPTTRLRIESLRLGEEPDVVRLEDLSLDLNLFSLLAGKLDITKLSLNEPDILIIKGQQGVRLAGFREREKQPGPGQEQRQGRIAAEGAQGGLQINLQSLAITGGRFAFRDELQKKEWRVTNLDYSSTIQLRGQDVTLSDQSLSADLLGTLPLKLSSPQITFAGGRLDAGLVSIEMPKSRITAALSFDTKNGAGEIDIAGEGIDLDDLKPLVAEFAPPLQPLNIKGTIKPEIKTQLASSFSYRASGQVRAAGISLQAKDLNVSQLASAIEINADRQRQSVEVKELSLFLNNEPISIQLKAVLENDTLTVNQLQAALFSGQAAGQGELALKSGQFNSNVSLKSLQIEKALSALAPGRPIKLSGTVETVNGRVKGEAGENLTRSLKGTAQVELRDAELKGTNIAGSVLRQIPIVTEALKGGQSPEVDAALNSSNTSIESLTGTFALGDGSMSTTDLRAISPLFSLEAKGRAGFDGTLDLASSIFFSPALMSGIIAKNPQAKNLTDEQGRLVVPLRLERRDDKISVLPDIGKLMERAAKSQLREKAGEAIDKALKQKGLGKLFGF